MPHSLYEINSGPSYSLQLQPGSVRDGSVPLSHIVQFLIDNFRPLPEHPSTPIAIFNMRKELANYPDKIFAQQLLFSIDHGFDIGYSGPQICNFSRNLNSAASHADHIRACLIDELQNNRMACPVSAPPLDNFCTSPIGVVPK